jgi:hypothetical protein
MKQISIENDGGEAPNHKTPRQLGDRRASVPRMIRPEGRTVEQHHSIRSLAIIRNAGT